MSLRAGQNRAVSNFGRTVFLIVLLLFSMACRADLLWEKCDTKNKLCADLSPYLRGVNYVLDRKPISAAFEAVVLYNSMNDEFGVFVIDRRTQKHFLTIAILPSHRNHDYAYEIEEVNSSSLVVAGFGTTYGDSSVRKQYFFDLDAKKVVSAFDKTDIAVEHIEFCDGTIFFASRTGANTDAIITAPVNTGLPGQSNHQFQLIKSLSGRPLEPILAIRRDRKALHFFSQNHRYIYASGAWTVTPNEEAKIFRYDAAETRSIGFPNLSTWVPLSKLQENLITIAKSDGTLIRYLTWNDDVSANAYRGEQRSGIYESSGATIKFYPLPQPPWELFAKYQPERVKLGYTKDSTIIKNEVGPYQLVGNKILFGLRFYDGEGHTGVGGYGQFDIETKEYELKYLPEIAASSVSALYVDDGLLWMGLYGQPEGAPYSDGLVSYDHKSGRVSSYPISGMVNVIRKWGDRVYVGTSKGATIVSPDAITTAKLNIGKDGHGYLVVNTKNR